MSDPGTSPRSRTRSTFPEWHERHRWAAAMVAKGYPVRPRWHAGIAHTEPRGARHGGSERVPLPGSWSSRRHRFVTTVASSAVRSTQTSCDCTASIRLHSSRTVPLDPHTASSEGSICVPAMARPNSSDARTARYSTWSSTSGRSRPPSCNRHRFDCAITTVDPSTFRPAAHMDSRHSQIPPTSPTESTARTIRPRTSRSPSTIPSSPFRGRCHPRCCQNETDVADHSATY